jgi:D-alanine-D-alanine ligase
VVHTKSELETQVHALEERYRGWSLTTGGIFAEQFVNGAEYTTLIVGPWDRPEHCKVYLPVQRVFHPSLPETERFLSFDRLWEIYETESPIGDYEDFYVYELPASDLIGPIQEVSLAAYCAVKGTGYGRVDLRMDPEGQLRVLEVNAQCGLSEDENYTSIGAILRVSGLSYALLVEDILRDALRRRPFLDGRRRRATTATTTPANTKVKSASTAKAATAAPQVSLASAKSVSGTAKKIKH